MECMAMFYFIKWLSEFRIVTEPCADRILLPLRYLYMSYIIHSHTKQTYKPGSDVGAVCHVGHIHLSISEFREIRGIDFQIVRTGILCYLWDAIRVNNPNIGYEKRKTDIYSDNFCSDILLRTG